MLKFLLIFVGYFIYVIDGFSSGAPQYVCLVPYPHHDSCSSTVIPQPNDILPFSITVDPDTYKENSELNIFIKSSMKDILQGILLTIKPITDDIIEPVGTFLNCNSTNIQFYNFSSANNSCVTHRTTKSNIYNMNCIYKAPSVNYGSLILSAVLVKSKKTFWVNVEKEIKYDGSKQRTSLFNPTNFLLQNETGIISGCGILKNCILYPISCFNKQNCQYMISFANNQDNVDFELIGPADGYLAMGISSDRKMKNDLVIVCANHSKMDKPSLQTGYTSSGPGKYFVTTIDPNIFNKRSGNIKFLKNDKAMVCKFSVKNFISNPISKYTPKNLSDHLYIFLADGNTYHSTVFVKKHKAPPLRSSLPIVLYSTKDYAIYYFREIEFFKQIHGTIMALGFMIFQPIAITIALHFRKNLSVKIKNRQLWFYMHLSLNAISLALMFIGYIYILYNEKFKFKIHGGFGTVVVVLTFINILMGFLRPDLNSKNRIYFYWAHFTNGILIRIFGYITFWLVFLTINLRNNLQMWLKFVIISWTLGELIFSGIFGILRCKISRKGDDKTSINAAFKYHISNWALVVYISFLCVLTFSLLYGLWSH